MSQLTEEQKEDLLYRAKDLAQTIFEEWDEWDMDAAVQGAIDDTADDRSYHTTFDGPREVAYDFLDENRAEIGWSLWEPATEQ